MNKSIIFFAFPAVIILLFSGCNKKDPSPAPLITIVQDANGVSSTFTGNGNVYTQQGVFMNSLTQASWAMSISGGIRGSFRLQVKDGVGKIVIDETLVVGQGITTLSGTTTTGTTQGNWAIIITLTNFDGVGSFSLSPA